MTSLRDFIPLEKLGQGSFSTVYKVKRISDGNLYALKKVRMNSLKEKEIDNAVNEIRILASLDSPYVIGYKQAIHDQKLNLLCIVMEYANGGDLQKRISEAQKHKALIVERQIWKAVIHVLRGLQIMHSKGILHRDLKSANIFLSDGCYKLGDLNVSKVNKGRLAYTQTGTPYYASPEVWRDQPYDSKSDIWSFGCIIYEMASLKPPFRGADMQSLYKNVQRGIYDRLPSCYSRDLQTFVGLCLQKNPKLRPSSSQLLANPVVQKYGDRLQMCKQEPVFQPINELLRTIKVPLGLKGLQKNLPKSKYQQPLKQLSPRTPIRQLSPRPAARQLSPRPAPPILPIKSNQDLSPRQLPIKPLSPRLSPKFSPRNRNQEPIKNLSLVRSHQRSNKVINNISDRLIESEVKKNNSYRREAQIRQIQRSLIVKQQQIQQYINQQLKRPVTSTPKTQQKGPIRIYNKNEQRERIINNSSDNYDVKIGKKRQQDYSSSRNIKNRQIPQQQPYMTLDKRKAQSQGNVSYKKMQYEINKAINKRDDYLNNLSKNSSNILKVNSKLQRRAVRPQSGKYRYNIMPSWWG